jgi:LacI family transcriptional regulator
VLSFAFVTTAGRLSIASERLRAYGRCVCPIDRESVYGGGLAGDLSIAWGNEAATRLFAIDCPQAVICANDLVALGVLETFAIRGTRVPEDVAVTGYDDSIAASVVRPRLTTVRQPLGALGEEAVRFIMSTTESPSRPRRELRLLPQLIVRESSAKLGCHTHVEAASTEAGPARQ